MALYIKLSCDVLTDSRILSVSPCAFSVWTRGLLWSKQHLTDGFVPDAALVIITLGITDALHVTRELVDAGLWERVTGGYTVGQDRWARHQVTSEEVKEKLAENRERVKRFRERRRNALHENAVMHYKCVAETECNDPPEPEPEPEPELKKEDISSSAVAADPSPSVANANGNGHSPTKRGTPSELATVWNDELGSAGWPRVTLPLSSARATKARMRLAEHPDQEFWGDVIAGIRSSPFLRGENDRGWKANFNWLLRPGSAEAVVEGTYSGAPRRKR